MSRLYGAGSCRQRLSGVNNHIAEHHLQTNHRIDWDSAKCITYCTNYYQRLTLESWFTNLEQTPLSPSQDYTHPDDHNLRTYEKRLSRRAKRIISSWFQRKKIHNTGWNLSM